MTNPCCSRAPNCACGDLPSTDDSRTRARASAGGSLSSSDDSETPTLADLAAGAMLAVVTLLLAAAGCSGAEVDPASRVTAPRILALRAEPPTVGLDGSATLDALVADSAGRRDDAAVTWRACSPWTPVLDPARDCGPDVSLPLQDDQVSVADLIARFGTEPGQPRVALNSRIADRELALPDLSACDAQILEVPLVAEVEVDGQRLTALKRLQVTATPERGERNPAIGELTLDGDRAPQHFAPGRDYDLAVALTDHAVDAGCSGSLSVHFYATAGELGDAVVELDPVAVPATSAVTSWQGDDVAVAHFWFVVQSDSGGIDWAELSLVAE